MKVAVVYPYRLSTSRELEYSIKSLSRIPHGGVFIIGDKPPYDVDAELIRKPKEHWARYSPYHDVISKLLQACDEIGGDMLLMNDDFFLMEGYDGTIYNRGTINDHLRGRVRDSYYQALVNTQNKLREGGYGETDFEHHSPMLVCADLLKIAIEELLPSLRSSRPFMIRTYYGNRFSVESEFMEDVKNNLNYKDLPVLSTNEMTFNSKIGEYIRENV